jgi:hypothetical protein
VLFEPEAHEPLVEARWDAARVERAIRAIAADAESAFDDGWPTHPADADDEAELERRFRTVHVGSAGVVHALETLSRRGLVELRRDYRPHLERPYEPDFPDHDHERSLWMGETGILLVRRRLSPAEEIDNRLARLVGANAEDERRELMWGSPGTMLAARALHDATGGDRWLALWRESASRLLDAWDPETNLWTQELYGQTTQYVGPAHGLAGCLLALAPEADADLHRRAAAAIRAQAVEEDGLANWRPLASLEGLRPGSGHIRVQWCHGAPGIVGTLCWIAPGDDDLERLLAAGGELTWVAGPLAKGASLCHGTAGNGYAFLALLDRTGDERWLERARSFAMHAVAQVERERARHGRGRYTLWTGDPGVALYLADCVAGEGRLPLPWWEDRPLSRPGT